ncbi:MAG: DUF4445 domain-containing protein [Clostridia bacterium]|jgi:uncharacterized 2Fe-2S/4Fe-4S cluster protein (DUF4445 family)|nr:DUF4445 domain-containing protein [Clostridia bacterium]
MSKFSVTFFPENISVEVEEGVSIKQAAALAGIEIKSTCGEVGTCGRCAVKVQGGKYKDLGGNISSRLRNSGHVLACRTVVEGDLTVEIPAESRLDEHQVLVGHSQEKGILVEKELDLLEGYQFNPICRTVYLELPPPTITENASDLTRLYAELRKHVDYPDIRIPLAVLQNLAVTLREADWKVSVTMACFNGSAQIVSIEAGDTRESQYAVAVDIGTTTVVAYLVKLSTGEIMGSAGTYNKQARFGDDVISRIIYVNEPNGLEQLHKAVIGTVNELIDKLTKEHGISPSSIHAVMSAGNSIMAHLFLGLTPKYIRLDPYIPTAADLPPVTAKELGLMINPEGWVFSFSALASYVGGDIVSGVLCTRMSESDEMVLFIDIGTNGEIVLGNRDFLVTCACSAGPAFEGGGITHGMRAMKGAIERLVIDPETYEVSVQTVGNGKPVGICGSGLIDCIAKLRDAGLIDRTGQFQQVSTPRYRMNEEGPEFVLVWEKDSGIDKDIVITEADIKNLIRSKGAVYAGIRSLLQMVSMDLEVIDKILIAGGFGNYLNLSDAIKIGLLPDVPEEKYEFVGNTSVKGAQLALLSREAYKDAIEIGRKMTYIELSVGNTFMDEFVSALFLPHTDLTLFPSVPV